MNPIDVGEIEAPSMQVNNLSFHEFAFAQKIRTPKWFSSDLKVIVIPNADGYIYHAKGSITNNSPYSVTGNVMIGGSNLSPVDLPSGATKKVNFDIDTVKTKSRKPATPAQLAMTAPLTLSISGTISGFRPGPVIGSEVKRSSGIRIFVLLSDVDVAEAK